MKKFGWLLAFIPVVLQGATAYVSNGSKGTLSVIDTSSNTVTRTITVGTNPEGMASLGQYLYVANFNSNNVSVIDTNTNTVIQTINVLGNPAFVAFSGTKGFVANFSGGSSGQGAVTVIDTTTNSVITTINDPSFNTPEAMVVWGNYLYVTNWGDNSGNTVTVVNTQNYNVAAVITVGPVGIGPTAAAVKNGRVEVANFGTPAGVSVVDANTNTLIATITDPSFDKPDGVIINGSIAYVTNSNSNTMSLVDLSTNTVISTVVVGPSGCAPLYNYLIGNEIYIPNFSADSVSIFNPQTAALSFVADPMSTLGAPFWLQTIVQPPTGFSGKQKKNDFGLEFEYYNQLTWNSSPDPTVIGYILFRNGVQIAFLNADVTSYQDHNRKRSQADTYTLFALNQLGSEAAPLTVQVGG